MAEICCGVVSESEATSCDTAARRRRIDLRRPSVGFSVDDDAKRRRFDFGSDVENVRQPVFNTNNDNNNSNVFAGVGASSVESECFPKYGMASVCGRRRDMEDAVAIHPSFCRRNVRQNEEKFDQIHYFGVYDGHGCSHVATRCRERMHEVVKEEVILQEFDNVDVNLWKPILEKSFFRMDKEVIRLDGLTEEPATCRCELQMPACETVGSTAVVAVVTPRDIIVANCGDSRAVLCRNGVAIPLSIDHKPDRPDEMTRIQSVGGRVIFWEGARVAGVLAMSRAIGDSYLKPSVSSEPEVTITGRTSEDECLILASDGLWDVVSNETACGVARMCLRGKPSSSSSATESGSSGSDDKACNDAAMLLTKLALARRSADNVSVVVVDLRKPT